MARLPSAAEIRRNPRVRPARAGSVFSAAETAELLDVPVGQVMRMLDQAQGVFFPHAVVVDGEWSIPAHDVRRIAGGGAFEPMISIRTLAELLEMSYHHVFRKVKGGEIASVTVLGEARVRLSEYHRLIGRRREAQAS